MAFVSVGEQMIKEEKARVEIAHAISEFGNDAPRLAKKMADVIARHGSEVTAMAFSTLHRQMVRK